MIEIVITAVLGIVGIVAIVAIGAFITAMFPPEDGLDDGDW